MVALRIETELMSVGPVNLTRSRQIVFSVPFEGFAFARVRKRQQVDPLPVRELLLLLRNGCRRGDRTIAGKHAPAKEVLGIRLNGVLEIAVKEAGGNALFEHWHQV